MQKQLFWLCRLSSAFRLGRWRTKLGKDLLLNKGQIGLSSIFLLASVSSAVSADFKASQLSPGVVVHIEGQTIEISSPAPGVCIAESGLKFQAIPGQRIRLKLTAEQSVLKLPDGSTQPNLQLPNQGGGLCLGLTQLTAKGEPISTVYSPMVLTINAVQEMTLETFVMTGAVNYSAQIRVVGVTGESRVSKFVAELLPALPDPSFSDNHVQRGPTGALEWMFSGKVRPLNIYHGNNQFGHDERILSEMHKAVPAGVSAISFAMSLPCNESNEEISATLDRFLASTGDTPFFLRVWLGPPALWLVAHPQDNWRYEDGTFSGYASPASAPWRAFAAENLEHLLRLIHASPYAHRLAGIVPSYYQTGEWIAWDPDRQAGFDEATTMVYAQWLQSKYVTLPMLDAAWGGNEKDWLAAAHPPSKAERTQASFGILRTSRERRARDWAEFYATLMPSAIDAIAGAIKKVSGGKLLVGVFYGYTIELTYSDVWPQQAGHLGLHELLASPHVDFLGSPYSYDSYNRAPGLPLDFMGPADSAALHGKLYFLEEDTFTHLAQPPTKDLLAPGYAQRSRNMDETLAVLTRNLGTCLAHGIILHWQSLLSDGRFDAPEIWKLYGDLAPWMKEQEKDRRAYQPEVAFVVDEKAYTALGLDSQAFYRRWMRETNASMSRLGTTVGYYLQSDLDKIPSSVRCLILPTSFSLADAQMEILRKQWLTNGKMAVFCWLPPGAASAHPGDTVSTIPGLSVVVHGTPLNPASSIVAAGPWRERAGQNFARDFDRERGQPFGSLAPYATTVAGSGQVLAKYIANGEGSCAWSQQPGFTTVFLGAPVNSSSQWQELLKVAGCHFYLDAVSDDWTSPDYVQGNGPFLMVQSGRTGSRTIRWMHSSRIFHWEQGQWKPVGQGISQTTWDFTRGVPEFFLNYL